MSVHFWSGQFCWSIGISFGSAAIALELYSRVKPLFFLLYIEEKKERNLFLPNHNCLKNKQTNQQTTK